MMIMCKFMGGLQAETVVGFNWIPEKKPRVSPSYQKMDGYVRRKDNKKQAHRSMGGGVCRVRRGWEGGVRGGPLLLLHRVSEVLNQHQLTAKRRSVITGPVNAKARSRRKKHLPPGIWSSRGKGVRWGNSKNVVERRQEQNKGWRGESVWV